MPQINYAAFVSYSSKQMYQLVNDVQSYPKFIPGCTGSRVLESSQTQMIAAIDVSKAGINKTFTTRNMLIDNKNILIYLVDGPLKKMIGSWKFTSLSSNTCCVKFHLDFEFTHNWIELALGLFLRELMPNMIQVFAIRAKEVYSAS